MRDPDIRGPAARAWTSTQPDGRADWQGMLIGYLVHCPFAHAFWEWWGCSVIHLRDIEGQSRPPHKQYPEAEYEITFFAIDPDRPVGAFRFLTPVDLVAQFHGVTDDQAKQILIGCIRLICDGGATPDSDFRSFWQETIKNTVEHMRLGGHATAKA